MPNRFAGRSVWKTDLVELDTYDGRRGGSLYLGPSLGADAPTPNEVSWRDDAEKPGESITSFEGEVESLAAQSVWRMR